MEVNDVKIDFEKVPPRWQLCFSTECPKRDVCLRRLATRYMPENKDNGAAVYPTVKIGADGCRFFVTGQQTRMACGFETLFAEVKSRDEKGLRIAMMQYLRGHSNYYRYNSGEKLLSPEQQEWIIDLFRRYGYTEGLAFDRYVDVYRFK